MLTHSRKLFSIILLAFAFALSVKAQSACPPQFAACLSQAEANVAASNAREVSALRNQVQVQQQALTDKDKSIAELKAANDANVADLKKALHDTEIQLADKTGQLIKTEAQVVQQSAIIQFMLTNGRTKKYGFLVF
jgi:uncharacterized protein involved in exopolysaccharide biosynthesis